MIDRAWAAFNAGDLATAETDSRRLLATAPLTVEGWLLLGQIARARRNPEMATRLARLAVAVAPDHADTLAALGDDARDHPSPNAVRRWRARAAAANPADGALRFNLALTDHEAGRNDRARAHLLQTIALAPDLAPALALLAWIEHDKRCFRDGGRWAARAARLDADAYASLAAGFVLGAGALSSARSLIDIALVLRPDSVEALRLVATIALGEGAAAAARRWIARAGAAGPTDPGVWAAAAHVHAHLDRLPAARNAIRRAIALDPGDALARYTHGAFDLALGDWSNGWRRQEGRLRLSKPAGPKVWTGESLAGKRLLIEAEQGLGDSIQISRFIPALARRAGDVVVRLPRPLQPLLAGQLGAARIVGPDAPLPAPDYVVPMLSLPDRLGLRQSDLPGPTPYLAADPERVQYWQRRFARRPGLKVGLVWSTNPVPETGWLNLFDGRNRSLPLGALRPLAHLPAQFISLQLGPPRRDLAALAEWPIEDVGDALVDFAETAAVAAALDLIITVDTAMAHLCGALGRPTWVCLRVKGCWRWGRGESPSLWYPTVRLFRQTDIASWADVGARVAAALADRIALGDAGPSTHQFATDRGYQSPPGDLLRLQPAPQ